VISPILANLYLHYALDLRVEQCRLGFQDQDEPERFLAELKERLAK